jgi:hypothetical protein
MASSSMTRISVLSFKRPFHRVAIAGNLHAPLR